METFYSIYLKNCSLFLNSEGDVLSAWMKALRTSTCACEQGVEKPGEQRGERPGPGLCAGLGKRWVERVTLDR